MEALRLAQLDTVIHRLNPLTKLFIMLMYWGTALFTFNIPVLLVMITLALILYPISHIPLRTLRIILTIMVGNLRDLHRHQRFHVLRRENAPVLPL